MLNLHIVGGPVGWESLFVSGQLLLATETNLDFAIPPTQLNQVWSSVILPSSISYLSVWAIVLENFLKFFCTIWHFYEVKVAKNMSR